MENWCNGWVVNREEVEQELFIQHYVKEKTESLPYLGQVTTVEFTDRRNQSRNNVLSEPDLVLQIFNHLDKCSDRANMANVCLLWAKLFLFFPYSPGVLIAYLQTLRFNDINGVRIVRSRGRLISQRCKCFMTGNMAAKFIMHVHQRRNAFQNTHLNPLNDSQIKQVDEMLRDMPPLLHEEAKSIATSLLARRRLSYVEVVDLT